MKCFTFFFKYIGLLYAMPQDSHILHAELESTNFVNFERSVLNYNFISKRGGGSCCKMLEQNPLGNIQF